MGAIRHRLGTLLGCGALVLLLAGCYGFTNPPTAVTQTSATLHGSVTCQANTSNNPCTAWFQYWPDQSTSVTQTSQVPGNSPLNNFDFSQPVAGLMAGMLYHYQLCGYGDTNVAQPGYCVSPAYPGGLDTFNSPGSQPYQFDLSATQNFRTATGSTTSTVDLGRVLSAADTNSNPISRDDGLSASYAPGQSLWVFGDTFQNGNIVTTLGSAAEGPFTPGQAPTSLNELPTPPSPPQSGLTSPHAFFPMPVGLTDSSGKPCSQQGERTAAWAQGAVTEPGASTVLVTYIQLCEMNGGQVVTEKATLAEYDPASNTFVASYTPFVAPPPGLPPIDQLPSPVFGNDGYLYFFDTVSTPSGPTVDVVRVATANHALWGQASSYQIWAQPSGSPAGWYDLSNSGSAISVLPPSVTLVFGGVQVSEYSATTSKKLAMVVQAELYYGSGHIQVLEASSPVGPWTAGPTFRLPDRCQRPDLTGLGCYAVVGHPELTTSQQFVYSWLSPGDRGGGGHLRIGAVAW